MKKLKILTFSIFFTLLSWVPFLPVYADAFTDVPKDHWAFESIRAMQEAGVVNGIGGGAFGLGQPVTRAQFVTFLVNLMGWDVDDGNPGRFSDNMDKAQWYYKYVETAGEMGATDVAAGRFRPGDLVTREEMAVMIVKTLGYDTLAGRLSDLKAPYPDVTENIAYINMAKDFGIIAGMTPNAFAPKETATREQAAAMLMRMQTALSTKTTALNGFYAIKSASHMALIPNFDSVGFGWGRLEPGEGGVTLNETSAGDNVFYKPDGYETPLGMARESGAKALLLVTATDVFENNMSFTEKIIINSTLRTQAAAAVSVAATDFDGVVVDFESLKGSAAREGLNAFLMELRSKMGDKLIYTAVHPVARGGREYFDGYDFKAIGAVSDKVILMAHDYNAKRLTPEEMEQGVVMTPLAPIDDIYVALKAATDPNTGVSDKSKLMLQISFDTAQWKTTGGKVTTAAPFRPDYDTLKSRLSSPGVTHNYDQKSESPYITFFNETDSTQNIVWYENGESVAAKVNLAHMFGVSGISVWRLGNMPTDGWNAVNSK